MPISTLNLIQVRNFKSASFELSPHVNLFFGENGSGKTTILESVYVLGAGRSFRAPQLNKLIQLNTEGASIEAQLAPSHVISEPLCLKMRKKHLDNPEYFISHQAVRSVSELAKFLPVQLLNLHGYLLLADAPEQRRKFMDWMMFHVEHSFMATWQTYQRTLKQRNALLKSKSSDKELQQWTLMLAEAGQHLHVQRAEKIAQWIEYALPQCLDLPGVIDLEMSYKPGWPTEITTLYDALMNGLRRDLALGFTHCGPHRSDLHITIRGHDASNVLSTGQQKTFVSALQISQVEWINRCTHARPLLLIDDLPSELDASARQLLADKISDLDAQILVTSVQRDSFLPFIKNRDYKLFHVEHGMGKVV